MRQYLWLAICALSLCLLAACGAPDGASISLEGVDRVHAISSMGNPAYGADSKIITDSAEIKEFIATFEGARIGKKLASEDVAIGFFSHWRFYKGDTLVAEYALLPAGDAYAVWQDDSYHAFILKEGTQSPYDLYDKSAAAVVVVDEDGKEMQRPAE